MAIADSELVAAIRAQQAWVRARFPAAGAFASPDRLPFEAMARPLPGFPRLVATALVGLAALSGCAGDDDRLTQGSTASTKATSAGDGTTEISGDDFDADEPEFEEELLAFYDQFIYAGDQHRTPDKSSLQHGSGLADVASPSVVAGFDAWRATNEAHGDGFQRVLGVSSLASILDIDVAGPRVTIRDCTKETRQTKSGQDVTNYVTRVVKVANEGGLYRVVDLDVEHQGDIFTAGYGCIPNDMAKEATATAKTAVEGFLAAQADPRAGLPAAVNAVVVDKLEADMTSSLAEQAAKGFSTTSPTKVSLSVLGIDPRGLGLVGVVSACITYPDGLALRELSSGKVLREVFPAGTANKVAYAVRFPVDASGPVAYATVSEELSTTC